MRIDFSSVPKNTDICINECLNLVSNLNPESDGLKKVKAIMERAMAVSGDEIADSFEWFFHKEKYGIGKEEYNRRVLDTTLEDIRRVAEKYLNRNNQVMILKPETK